MSNRKDPEKLPIAQLLAIFVALKLAGVITWSWIWVLSPAWISAIVLFFGIIVITVRDVIDEASGNRKWSDDQMMDFGSWNRARDKISTHENFEDYKKLKK